jgi:MSHA biogenesis protein MshK
MADRLMQTGMTALAAAMLGSTPALAQLSDPTRPPDAVTAGDGAATTGASGVQTVIVRPRGKSVAVINGREVKVGDRIGDKRVLKISETEIVLKGESGREVIKVIPAITKTPARSTPAVKSGAAAKSAAAGTK